MACINAIACMVILPPIRSGPNAIHSLTDGALVASLYSDFLDVFIKLISRFCALPTFILLQKRLPLNSFSFVPSFSCISATAAALSSTLISFLKIYNDIVA